MSNLFTALGSGALNAMSDDAFALMFGVPPAPNAFDLAVAERFKAIRPTLAEKKKGEPNELDGLSSFTDYCYDGGRTEPESLGHRFAGRFGEPPVEEVAAGKWDAHIAWTWHEAASSEYWYRHEKDWGDYSGDDGWS